MGAGVVDIGTEVIQGIKVANTGVMNIDDIWSFVYKT
jgi:hypothetical protein